MNDRPADEFHGQAVVFAFVSVVVAAADVAVTLLKEVAREMLTLVGCLPAAIKVPQIMNHRPSWSLPTTTTTTKTIANLRWDESSAAASGGRQTMAAVRRLSGSPAADGIISLY